jgi:hypothetical protein
MQRVLEAEKSERIRNNLSLRDNKYYVNTVALCKKVSTLRAVGIFKSFGNSESDAENF